MHWEDIDLYHRRAKVPGGWLVKIYEKIIEAGQCSWCIAVCFVPDPTHSWKIRGK